MIARTAALFLAGVGLLVLVAGSASSTLLIDQIDQFVEEQWPDAPGFVGTIFLVLAYLVGLGGLAVIIGGALAFFGFFGFGRLLSLLGVIGILTSALVTAWVIITSGEGDRGWAVDATWWVSFIGGLVALWLRRRVG